MPAERGQFWRHWWWAVLCGGVAFAGLAMAFILGPGGSPISHSFSGLTAQERGASPPGSLPARSAKGTSPSPALGHPAGPPTHTRPLAPQLKASLQRWATGRGGDALALVSRQLGVSAQTGGLRLYPVMKQACRQLSVSVTAADAGPPIPDATMQRQYATALATLAAAADHCQAAISVHLGGESTTTSVNQAMLERSRAELGAGARDLYLGTSQIRLPGHRR